MLEPQYQEHLIDQYVSLESLLQKHSLTFPEAEERAAAFCEDFYRLANEHYIRTDSLIHACLDFLNLPETLRSEELRFLYLATITDCGLLFPDDSNRTREQNVRCYLEQSQKMAEFSAWFDSQKLLKQALSAIKQSSSRPSGRMVSEAELQAECNALLHIATQQKSLRSGRENPIFAENLMELAKLMNLSDFRKVKPFLYFAVLYMRRNFMLTRKGYSPNLKSLLQYKTYQIAHNNEKNYALFSEEIRLYIRLCEHFRNDADTDILLSDYCFSACSNLSEWYYFHADMEDLPVPESASVRLRLLLPVGFPRLPADPHAQDLGELRFSEDFSIEECVLSESIAKHPDLLTEYLHLLAENGDTRLLHHQLCSLSDLAISFTNMALAAEMLWESAADWLEEGMSEIVDLISE